MIPYYVLATVEVGPLTLNVWGVFAGLAFAAALVIALKEAKRKNINEDNIFDLAVLTLIGGVAGARMAFVLENWDYFSKNKFDILSLKEGGLMFYGGALGAMLLFGAYLRLKHISGWKVADALIPSFAIGEFIGRIGCALADLHIGTLTSLPWAQEYSDGSLRHPVSIYMSLNGLAMFMVFWFLRKKQKIEGALFPLFVLWYSGIRFFLDFFRCDDLAVCDPRYSGYTLSQYISLGVFIITLIFLIHKYNNHMEEKQNEEKKEEQGSVVSFTEVEEVIFESKDNSAAFGGIPQGSAEWKNKLRIMAKKPWAAALAFVLVLIAGMLIASLYYGNFYYGKMFKSSPFSFQGKTWVSYDDPIVKMTIVNDPKCEACEPEPIIKNLNVGFAPTLAVDEINFDSQKGKDLIEKFNIKFFPAFIFDIELEKLASFKTLDSNQVSQYFIKKDNQYSLNFLVVKNIAGQMGINIGKFINPPQVSGDDRIKGSESAPITIIEFSDFECPFCKAENDVVKQVLAAYPDKVRLVFKHLPLPMHANASFAAEAAECAGDQGKFFEMADVLFANQEKLDAVSVARYARELKLDAKKFKECTDSGKFKNKVANDSKIADEYGITGTPAFFVGDEFLNGAIPIEQFKQVIDAKLAK